MKCLYCGKEIDKEEEAKIEEAGVEPFCDAYCFGMYNAGYPIG